jgi:glutathione transport system permease protein
VGGERSKGMGEVRVVSWHVARNVLVLVLTAVGLQFGALLSQAVVVEQVFSWPGLGSLLISSINDRDIPAVQGCILVIVLFFLAINAAVDVAYSLIDPRIRYG